MIKIGFDAKRLLFNPTGLGNYARQWVGALSQISDFEIQLYAPKSGVFNAHSAQTPTSLTGLSPKLTSSLWRTFSMGKQAQKEGCQIFHGLSNEIPLGKITLPRVCTIHDVIFKQFPQFYGKIDRTIYDLKTQYACKNSEAIVVTSETTKWELQKYYNADTRKIHVIYQAIDPTFTQLSWQPLIENPYLIYYSSFNPRKNQIKLIQAFAQIANHIEHNLVIAGKGNGKRLIEQEIIRLKLGNRIQLIESPSNDELQALLVNCAGFVYPSLQEGFGIPLVEAATVGVPMAVSDISIFRELTDNAAHAYFDPEKVESISQSLIQLCGIDLATFTGKEHYKHLIEKTSAQTMTEQASKLYRSLI
jgi:glycosyltransferase involved in cell wall biosynthesis